MHWLGLINRSQKCHKGLTLPHEVCYNEQVNKESYLMTIEQLKAQLAAEGVKASVTQLPSQFSKDQPLLLGGRKGHSNRRNPHYGNKALKTGRV